MARADRPADVSDVSASGRTPPDRDHLAPQYWAFISYRHADNQQAGRQWATWLHQQLESYEVPDDLVGQTNSRGDRIPDRLYPVFRDEDELPADADLSTAIENAVRRSRCMVVLCSPRAALSKYVADEIRFFKQLGRDDRILAVLIDGEPNASWNPGSLRAGYTPDDECFPKPLMHPVGPDGQLDESTHAEPIAADFRLGSRGGEGWTNPAAYREVLTADGAHSASEIRQIVRGYEERRELALQKIIAGILGLPLETVRQRGKAFELAKARRRARTLAAWLTVSVTLAVLATAGGLFGWQQMRAAQAREAEAERAGRVHDIRARAGLKRLCSGRGPPADLGPHRRILQKAVRPSRARNPDANAVARGRHE